MRKELHVCIARRGTFTFSNVTKCRDDLCQTLLKPEENSQAVPGRHSGAVQIKFPLNDTRGRWRGQLTNWFVRVAAVAIIILLGSRLASCQCFKI